jgi:Ni,Fe-hydrogenase III large subunit
VAATNYERKIQSFFGLTAVGNPDNRPLILHENWPENVYPLRKDFALHTRPGTAKGKYEFQRVNGDGIYEVPVGPIHAGIIEPGHFRFSLAGESIMLLEARLGYVHKGTEKLFESLSLKDQLKLSEKISGDSSFSHSLAFCQAIEQLADITVPVRAKYLRTVYAELERLANHLGDIGALMLDAGFNFGGAHGAHLREIAVRINQQLTGSRFLRGVNAVGGVTKDIDNQSAKDVAAQLSALLKDFNEVITVAEDSASLLNRLKSTGPLLPQIANDYSALGVAAKAVGIEIDARVQYPYAAYDVLPLKNISTEQSGDVNARFYVRVKEVRSSIDILHRALKALPTGDIVARYAGKAPTLAKDSMAIGCVEGWRGEILHFITTDNHGNINRIAVRDPSFINWQIVGYCGQTQIIPDFPLINKSFNLSYTGHDL